MLSIKLRINNLDYDSIIVFALPILKENPPDIKNPVYNMTVKKILNTNSANIKMVLSLTPRTIKAWLIEKQIAKNVEKIENGINKYLVEQNIFIHVKNLLIVPETNEDSYIISFIIDEINYISIVKKVLPFVTINSFDDEMNTFLMALFSVMNLEFSSTEKIIDSIDKNVLERFLVYLADKNSEKINFYLESLAKSKNIILSVDYFYIERKTDDNFVELI